MCMSQIENDDMAATTATAVAMKTIAKCSNKIKATFDLPFFCIRI